MNDHKLLRCGILVTLIFFWVTLFPAKAAAAELDGNNRFNVVVVLDASGSMQHTDPNGYRFRAVSQFTNLLSERGNVLGGVVFHTDVVREQEPVLIQKQAEKDAAIEQLRSVTADGGWTNIGAGLSRAVSMIQEKGNPAIPSVILLLSDGSTDMPTAEEMQASLDRKAEAIQAARENDITIYSVCLNANQAADVAEMQQISTATGGVFQEVTAAEDLQDTFNTFYELIYGTSTITLFSDVFPDSGHLETTFDVPGLGVEEVNIIIYGNTEQPVILRPDGAEGSFSSSVDSDFSMLKLTDIAPGTWTLVTEGVPGDDIKINMVYNTNLGVQVAMDPAQDVINPAEQVTVTATLTGDHVAATNNQQYIGYAAELLVMDAYGDYVESVPMQVVDNHFETVRSFDEGVYYYRVVVTGNHIEKESESFGPLTSSASALTEAERTNTPPSPVKDVVEASVKIWPVKGGTYALDMNTLAVDAEDDVLDYRVVSSAFMEGTDYTVKEDGILYMDHFSLSKGAFTIRATDTGGLSCDIEVIVRTINISLLTAAGLFVLAAAIVAGIVISLCIALRKPFRGTISAQSYCNGAFQGTPRNPRRGRCKLSEFRMDDTGLNYQKSYFQATGENYIELHTDIPVIWNGKETQKIRIISGVEIVLSIRRDDPRQLYIRFDSRVRSRGRSGAPKGRRRPVPGGRR